jgi:energy-converting hydrogenase Eha subunit A
VKARQPQETRFGLHADVYGMIILSTAVTITIQIKEFVAFAAALVIVTIVMLRLYLPAATKVKHLRSSTAGALVGLTAEVLEGLKVINAYGHQDHFVKVCCIISAVACRNV